MRIQAWEWNDESTATTRGQYQRVTDLKRINPQLKVLLAVGGWTFGSQIFSQMVSNPISRATFIFSAINFLKSNGFDGLDLDWEFPAQGAGSSPQDKFYLSVLIEETKQAFIPHGLMLTASVAVNPKDVDAGYEVDRIARNLDFITLMTYNYHGSWDSYTGFNSPLYARPNEVGQDRYFNVDYGVNYWLNKGLPREKLIVGTATYGRTFRLNSPLNNKPGDAAYSVGTQGQWTKEAGILSYYEICQKLAQGWKRGYSLEQRVPYADNGYEWVGYDDLQSLKEKADYINIKGLGGAMVWSYDLDDHSGKFCGQGRYPLINTLKSTLLGGSTNVVVTQSPQTTASCAQTHQVQSGETCYTIWAKYSLDEATFYKYNPNIQCLSLQIGQIVCVRSTVEGASTALCPSNYLVQPGDSCYSIYTKFGLTSQQFTSLNPTLSCSPLLAGLTVNILKIC